MSAPEVILVARLKAITAVTDLIDTRVYPVILPETQSTLPSIVYERTSDAPSNHASGATGTHETRLEVFGMAATYSGAKALAAAVRGDESTAPTGLSGWTDADGNVWHLDGESDETGRIERGQDVYNYYGVSQEFVVWN